MHLNFSPVIVYEGWDADYAALFEEVDDALSPAAKEQLAAEVIFLTHNDGLHEVNLRLAPEGGGDLWTPETQELKRSEVGAVNLRYGRGGRAAGSIASRRMLAERLPYCGVRYAF